MLLSRLAVLSRIASVVRSVPSVWRVLKLPGSANVEIPALYVGTRKLELLFTRLPFGLRFVMRSVLARGDPCRLSGNASASPATLNTARLES